MNKRATKHTEKKFENSNFSKKLIEALKDEEDLTLNQIGDLFGGLSKSYISRVLSGENSLTFKHLGEYEKKRGESAVLYLFVRSYQREGLSNDNKKMFDDLVRILSMPSKINPTKKI